MKYAYLNNVFISRLYLHYKNTPKKNITKIKIAKMKKNKYFHKNRKIKMK
jgi:hypothetical protein